MKIKNKKQIENCLTSELRNMISEYKLGTLNESIIFNYFRNFLLDANVDSEIVVNVLENFGELGKEEARNIKVEEGW
jgi:hypothetical protein